MSLENNSYVNEQFRKAAMHRPAMVDTLNKRLEEVEMSTPERRRFLFNHHSGKVINVLLPDMVKATEGKAWWQSLAQSGRSYKELGSIFDAGAGFYADVHVTMAPALKAYDGPYKKSYEDKYLHWLSKWEHMTSALNTYVLDWGKRESAIRNQARSLLQELKEIVLSMRVNVSHTSRSPCKNHV